MRWEAESDSDGESSAKKSKPKEASPGDDARPALTSSRQQRSRKAGRTRRGAKATTPNTSASCEPSSQSLSPTPADGSASAATSSNDASRDAAAANRTGSSMNRASATAATTADADGTATDHEAESLGEDRTPAPPPAKIAYSKDSVKEASTEVDRICKELFYYILQAANSENVACHTQDHILLLGASGTGKTELLKQLIAQTPSFVRHIFAPIAIRADSAAQFEDGETVFQFAGFLPKAINVLKEQIFQRKLPSVELSTFLQTQNAAPAGLGSQQPDWLSEEDARAAYEAMKQAEALTFQKPEKQRLMRRRRVLLIDDVFCFAPLTFAVADIVLRGRHGLFSRPFGGMMVIAAGDPLKGKPCSSHEWVEDVALGDPQDSDDEEQAEDDGAAQDSSRHALLQELASSTSFKHLFAWFNMYTLHFNFRLQDDMYFAEGVARLRVGELTPTLSSILADRACDEAVAPEATYIFFNAPDLRQHDIDRQQQQIADEVQLYFHSTHSVSWLSTAPIKTPQSTHQGATVRLCATIPGTRYLKSGALCKVIQMSTKPDGDTTVATSVEIEGPLAADKPERAVAKVMEFDNDAFHYDAAKSRYQRVTRGTVHAIPLSTVRSGYMVNAIHCRQAASLPNVVLHVPLDYDDVTHGLYTALTRVNSRAALHISGSMRFSGQPGTVKVAVCRVGLRAWQEAESWSKILDPRSPSSQSVVRIDKTGLEPVPDRNGRPGEGRPLQATNRGTVRAYIWREKRVMLGMEVYVRFLGTTAGLSTGKKDLRSEGPFKIILTSSVGSTFVKPPASIARGGTQDQDEASMRTTHRGAQRRL